MKLPAQEETEKGKVARGIRHGEKKKKGITESIYITQTLK